MSDLERLTCTLMTIKQLLPVFVAALCGCGSVYSAFMARARSTALLCAAADSLDLGSLRQYEHATATFHLSNQSDIAVRIVRVLAHCSCTGTKVTSADVPPGATTEVIAKFNSGTARGAITLRIDVLFEAEGHRSLEQLPLYLQARVRPDFGVSDSKIEFCATSDATRTIEVYPDAAPSINILNAYCTHPAVDVHAVPPSGGQTKWLVRARFEHARWATHRNNTEGELVLHTDSDRERTYRLKVQINPE